MSSLAYALLALLALLLATLAWALVEPYFIDVEAFEHEVPALPQAWEGRRVAVIADLQLGMRMANVPTIRRIVRRIVQEAPGVVLIAGDFVYQASGRPHVAREAAELLRPLVEAGLPTYAVLGNHDYAAATKDAPPDEALAAAVRGELEAIGIRVLENEAIPLPSAGGGEGPPLHLVGLGSHVVRRDRPDEALAGLPAEAPRLVLMHHPNTFTAMPPGSAPLAFAGHTHGGQFRIPFTPDWTWMTYAKDDEVHADGFDDDFGGEGNQLWVNRGIGFSVLPLRLNCPPELTLVTLRRRGP